VEMEKERRKFIDEYKPKILHLLDKNIVSPKEIAVQLGLNPKKYRPFISSIKQYHLR